ncbi:MAG TPA: ornithine cyclodeaminase family protein [Caulobacteraceae bacterium]|jgi:ornithine cyclodeaminase
MRFIDKAEVGRRLTYEAAIALVREAMIAFSAGRTRQLLRSILPLAGERMFGVMPGALGEAAPFGAKLISVFPGNFSHGLPSHQGLIVLFDPESGAAVCAVDAGEVTAIRTAAASAVATDALARPDARRLAILGYGEQATTHLRALTKVRPISEVAVWGRSPERAARFAAAMEAELGLPCAALADAHAAVAQADIVCTLTAATDPILAGAWLAPGSHVNLVGAGHAGQAEADAEVIVRSLFIADSREGVEAQGGEFRRARAAGHDVAIAGEIGEVLAGTRPGRQDVDEITVYKSLGHVVQDLACAWALHSGEGL